MLQARALNIAEKHILDVAVQQYVDIVDNFWSRMEKAKDSVVQILRSDKTMENKESEMTAMIKELISEILANHDTEVGKVVTAIKDIIDEEFIKAAPHIMNIHIAKRRMLLISNKLSNILNVISMDKIDLIQDFYKYFTDTLYAYAYEMNAGIESLIKRKDVFVVAVSVAHSEINVIEDMDSFKEYSNNPDYFLVPVYSEDELLYSYIESLKDNPELDIKQDILKIFDPKEMIKLAVENGYVEDRINGDHHIFVHNKTHKIVVIPDHELGYGLMYKIQKQIKENSK